MIVSSRRSPAPRGQRSRARGARDPGSRRATSSRAPSRAYAAQGGPCAIAAIHLTRRFGSSWATLSPGAARLESSSLQPGQPRKGGCSPRGQALAGVACRRRQKKYESPQSTPVAAAQPHASGPSPTERWAMSAEPRSMAKPA